MLHFLELDQRLIVLGQYVQFLGLRLRFTLVQRRTRACCGCSRLTHVHEESNRPLGPLLDQGQNEVIKNMPKLKPLDPALDHTELPQRAIELLLILLLRQVLLHVRDQFQVHLLQLPVDLLDLFIQVLLVVFRPLASIAIHIEHRFHLPQIDEVIRDGYLHLLVVFEDSGVRLSLDVPQLFLDNINKIVQDLPQRAAELRR